MVIAIPATGSTIRMGGVYHAYNNITPSAGTNVSLSASLGTKIGLSIGTRVSLSSSFGGRTGTYDYL
jgi:hypothetical protein